MAVKKKLFEVTPKGVKVYNNFSWNHRRNEVILKTIPGVGIVFIMDTVSIDADSGWSGDPYVTVGDDIIVVPAYVAKSPRRLNNLRRWLSSW